MLSLYSRIPVCQLNAFNSLWFLLYAYEGVESFAHDTMQTIIVLENVSKQVCGCARGQQEEDTKHGCKALDLDIMWSITHESISNQSQHLIKHHSPEKDCSMSMAKTTKVCNTIKSHT